MNYRVKNRIKRIFLLQTTSPVIMKACHPYGYRFPFMLKYMEALLKQNRDYEVSLFDMLANPVKLNELLRISRNYTPDLIVMFATTRDHLFSLQYASCIKRYMDSIIICVGQDATARPGRYIFKNSPIDIVIPGEAEIELLTVIQKLNSGHEIKKITNLYLNKDPIIVSQLDDLPFSSQTQEDLRKYYHVYPLKIYRRIIWGHILSSRGCPYSCIFCSQPIRETFGKEIRLRNNKKVVDEIEYLMDKKANIIIFDDDNFTTSKEHVISICEEIKKRKLSVAWTAHARIDNVTPELLKEMKDAGCTLLRFGVESASKRVLKILKKTDCDNWVEQSKSVFKFCKKIGIDTAALFLIGSPTETKEEIRETMKFAQELNPDIIQVSFFTFYPGSEAFKQFGKSYNGIDASKVYHYLVPQPMFNLTGLSTAELQELHKSFYRKFLCNFRFVVKHFSRYALFYLYNPCIFRHLFKIANYLVRKKVYS